MGHQPTVEQLRQTIAARIATLSRGCEHRNLPNAEFNRGSISELEQTVPVLLRHLDAARYAAESYRDKYMEASGDTCPRLAWDPEPGDTTEGCSVIVVSPGSIPELPG